ncbi:hypothetical protein PSR1_03455 [Anaeromyxobacter sp. PSR-1]|nr:hypothetical protein PSR1_03455 [Anaeromyxobacter sp. PSR-1]
MARVVASSSWRIARAVPAAAATSAPHDGCQRWTARVPIHCAKDSFSQISVHHGSVTRSPNQWCDISWAMVSAIDRRSSGPCRRGSNRSADST